MRTKLLGVTVSCALLLLAVGCGASSPASSSGGGAPATSTAPAPPPSSAAYFKGKTVTLIVPNAPGGVMDQYARMLAPYINKYLGSAQIKVDDVKGAGGVIGINKVWSSRNDGTVIAYTNADVVLLTSMLKEPGVTYDGTKFVWLGNTVSQPRVLVVGKKSGVTDLAQLKAVKVFKYPSEGFDDDFDIITAMAASLPFHLQVITGYSSQGQTFQSIITGRTDGTSAGFKNVLPELRSGDFVPILGVSETPLPGYPKVPLWKNIATGQNKQVAEAMTAITASLSRTFFGPPNMNPTAEKLLRTAIAKAVADPGLLARAKKAHFPIQYMSGSKEQALVQSIARSSGSVVPLLKKAQAAIAAK